jgi:hypothetical protein
MTQIEFHAQITLIDRAQFATSESGGQQQRGFYIGSVSPSDV